MNRVGGGGCPPGRDQPGEEPCSEVKGRAQSKLVQMPVELEARGEGEEGQGSFVREGS